MNPSASTTRSQKNNHCAVASAVHAEVQGAQNWDHRREPRVFVRCRLQHPAIERKPPHSERRGTRASNRRSFFLRRGSGNMSSTKIRWGRILIGGLLAEAALILAIVPLGLRLGENFLHYTAPPGSFITCFLGALWVCLANPISFHSARDVGRSRRGADLRRHYTRAA